MNFTQVPPGSSLFIDANILLYHFTNDALYGAACTTFIKQVEQNQISGFTSTHVLADVAHRLMTLEAISLLGWPAQGIAARLRKNYREIGKLNVYEQALARIPLLGVRTLSVTESIIQTTPRLSRQHELLTGDALVVALMLANNLTLLASNDSDFDRVAGISRYGPV